MWWSVIEFIGVDVEKVEASHKQRVLSLAPLESVISAGLKDGTQTSWVGLDIVATLC